MAKLMVDARNVRKSYGSNQVLNGMSLTVEQGEVLCIIGPSGSGKSTFLRCLNHLESIDGGRIYVNDELMGYRQVGNVLHELKPKDIAQQRQSIGMVFQRFNLFPHMTALQNVIEAPVGVAGIDAEEAKKQGLELLAQVGLQDKAEHY
ncbi:MAG: amino acid ABC transporter ATP-binding protein, partial [Rhodoluna sp.]|nr:amino acid ABC transporter ATP-binding protein [Rhodoluna sp.]